MLALLEAKKSHLLGRHHWLNNLVSGIIVGIVALPLAMAFAIASGVRPEQGLYTSIIAGLIVSIFGGSRFQIAGPTGAFVVILSTITAQYGIEGLQIATLMAGAILLVFGALKLGSVIKFIPSPVIVGFTTGIGVIIWVGQWREFFGLKEINASHFHIKLMYLIKELPQFHLNTTLLAFASLFLVIFTQRITFLRRVPGPLFALLVVTSLQLIFDFDGIRTIGSAFGSIPQGLPKFTIPSLNLNKCIELIGPAFTIAMLGAIESLLSAVVADGMTQTRHDSNQELVGQGLANIAAPLLGGFAATGAIARTATNIRNGATSPLSGIVHALTLALILLLLAPLATNIPLCTLAAILFMVAWNMSEVKHFIKMLQRAPKSDTAILLITFFLTLFADLTIAVYVGVILAMLQFLRRMAASFEIKQASEYEIGQEFSRLGPQALPPDVLVFSIEGPLFFGAVENFERALQASYTTPKYLIIRLKWTPFIDFTAIQTLESVIKNLHKRKVRVMLSGANERVLEKLNKARIIELIDQTNNFHLFEDALIAVKKLSQGSE
ncbi:MAG: sulfate permease [Myxococcales bacterium]|nr:sulfate permease [Myxococcales bacterium]USN51280.1 MAG: sulfate permease [Myxococcales bacterium]